MVASAGGLNWSMKECFGAVLAQIAAGAGNSFGGRFLLESELFGRGAALSGMNVRFPQRVGLVRLSLLALALGLVAGIGAVAFRALIGLIHNIAFLGSFSVAYDASIFTPPSPWGALLLGVHA